MSNAHTITIQISKIEYHCLAAQGHGDLVGTSIVNAASINHDDTDGLSSGQGDRSIGTGCGSGDFSRIVEVKTFAWENLS